MRVETPTRQDVARLLLLIALMHLCSRDGTDLIRLYRQWRNRASAFFDACLSGKIMPVANKFQAEMNTLMPESQIAHLYLPGWGSADAAYYASLVKDHNGLWRLRHRRLRSIASVPARDGILILWGDVTPSPDVAISRIPALERVLTGGVACKDFGAEAENNFEVRRQLSHTAIVAHLFDALHHNRLVTRHNPGRVLLQVDTGSGDGWVHPYAFISLAVRPYAPTCAQKARVTVWANASQAGLYAEQTPRCIIPSVKGATAYQQNPSDRTEGKLLAEMLLSRLLPLIGVLRADQRVDIYGLHYDADQERGIIAEFGKGLSLQVCKGLPLVRLGATQPTQRVWVPNIALLTVLREAIYDPTPDETARYERWDALTRVFRFFGVSELLDLPNYLAGRGLPLPDGADKHIAEMVIGEQKHFKD